MTPFVLNCHTVLNRHLEVCLQFSRLLNENSKLKSDNYTLWQLYKILYSLFVKKRKNCIWINRSLSYRKCIFRVIFMEDHLKVWLSYSFEWPDRSLHTSEWSFESMSWTYSAMVFHENISTSRQPDFLILSIVSLFTYCCRTVVSCLATLNLQNQTEVTSPSNSFLDIIHEWYWTCEKEKLYFTVN